MVTELATRANGAAPDAAVMEKVIATGDLEALTAAQRVNYYRSVCDSVGLNWLTQPFQYIKLNGKLTLYARKDATDQLRDLKGVNITITSRERIEDVYVVTARATLAGGRVDESIGAVPIGTLKGEALANALMKAETKAKRRVTLSACGLGWLDESEVGSIPNAAPVRVDHATGEIVGSPAPTQPGRMHGGEPDEEPHGVAADAPVDYAERYKPDLQRLQSMPGAAMLGRQDREYLRSLKNALTHDAKQLRVELPSAGGWDDAVAWSMNAVAMLVERADAPDSEGV